MKLSKLSIFLIVFFNNFLITDYYFTPLLYSENPYRFYLFSLILLLITTILFFIIPKINGPIIENIKKSKYIKILLSLFMLIEGVLISSISSQILSRNFFQGYPSYLFLILLIIFIFMISKFNIRSIINSSYVFFILIVPFLIYSVLSHYDFYDFSEILLKSRNLKWSYLLIMLYLIFNNIIFYLFITENTKRPKLLLIIPTMLSIFYEAVESIVITSLFGKFGTNFDSIALTLYNIEPNSLFWGNFDFVYVYLTVIISAVKLLVFTKLTSQLFKKEDFYRIGYLLTILLVSYILSFKHDRFRGTLKFFILTSTIIMIIFTLYLWRIKNEKNN